MAELTAAEVSRQVVGGMFADGASNDDAEQVAAGATDGSQTREKTQTVNDNSHGTANDAAAASANATKTGADNQEQSNQGDQTVTSLGSTTLDDVFSNTEAGTAAKLEGDAANLADTVPIVLSGDSPITVNGVTMKFSEYQAFGGPKAEYDRERESLRRKGAELDRDAAIVNTVMPHVEAVQNNPYLRTFTDTYLAEKARGASEDEANAIAEATASARVGWRRSNEQQPTVDPRLVPPSDETGQPLPTDDSRYQAWALGEARIAALAEQQATKIVGARDAERQRKEDGERAVREASEKDKRDEQQFRDDVYTRNKETMKTLVPLLKLRGVVLDKVPKHVFLEAVGKMLDRVALPIEKGGYGKDLRSDDYLRSNMLQPGDMAAFIDASGIAERLKLNPTATSTTNGATNGHVATNGEQNGAAVDERTSAAEGHLRTARTQAKRPLDAGGPSENMPGYREGGAENQGQAGWKTAYDGMFK